MEQGQGYFATTNRAARHADKRLKSTGGTLSKDERDFHVNLVYSLERHTQTCCKYLNIFSLQTHYILSQLQE